MFEPNSGASYVVFGKANGFPEDLSLAELNGLNGFRLSGVALLTFRGIAVGAAGDVNADGFDGFDRGWGNGRLCRFREATGFEVIGNLTTLDGASGFKISGVRVINSLLAVGAGDVNGDGYDDVIVGAGRIPYGSNFVGATFVIFGQADVLLPTSTSPRSMGSTDSE